LINTNVTSEKDLRSFGLILGVVFLGIGLWPWIKHDVAPNLIFLSLALVFGGGGLLIPRALTPLYHVWMKIGFVLGWVNTRIILSLGFFGIFTPVGVAMRMAGKDPMRRGFDPMKRSYRVERTIRDGKHMEHQF